MGADKTNFIQNRKGQHMEKQVPGCLGKMVNLFDLHHGVAANRLLTDKPHRDGFSLARSRSDVARMSNSSFGDQIKDKIIVSDLKRSTSVTKLNGSPMKTLIAQEMSKEVASKRNSSNLVARLTGLDTLPHLHSKSTAHRSVSKGYSRHSLSYFGTALECWESDHGFLDKQMQCERDQCQEHIDCIDVYEIWKQSQKVHKRDSSPCKERYNESTFEKKIALVHQKFTEAKHLATDEKGCQSKEFIDAVEVLSSNRDLFLKFLQESYSLFSHHLYNMQPIVNPPPETKHITVLRPSKMVDSEKLLGSREKIEKQSDKPKLGAQNIGWDMNSSSYAPAFDNQKVDEYPSQPTQIVVLKPIPGKTHDIKAVVSPSPSPPKMVRGKELFDESEGEEAQESRETAKEITRQLGDYLIGHKRDETLLYSVFSNGYISDDSSFVISENEYTAGNLSDSEIMSPASRQSWGYINKYSSPCSTSFSHASCSPESSVCREAKKRLSERLVIMKSNASSLEQKGSHRSSSTLGEMLALLDKKKLERSEEQAFHPEKEPKVSSSCLTTNVEEDAMINSSKGLSRSKSLPVSSTAHGARINVEVLDPEAGKQEVAKELIKAKGMKSSLKGKVSGLFFSRNKKSSNERSGLSQSKCDNQSSSPEIAGSLAAPCDKGTDDASSLCISNNGFTACSSSGLHASSSKCANPDATSIGTRQVVVPYEAVLSVAKPGNMSENQDQPYLLSVLEPPFDEDDDPLQEPCRSNKSRCAGSEVVMKSNLIGKSPPIESIARTLSWEYSHVEAASRSPFQISSRPAEDEQCWPSFIQSLLSEAGLDANLQPSLFFARWHSAESPLDPVLRDKYSNINSKELLQEGKRRQRRSFWKLVFDSVNEALLKSTIDGLDIISRTNSCSGSAQRFSDVAPVTPVDYMWAQMKEWFVNKVRCSSGECGDNSLVVESVVRNEVVGKGRIDKMGVELDNLGKEMEGKLLEELVEEALLDLADRES